MKSKTKTTALQEASLWLDQAFAQGKWHEGDQLPPIAQLAKSANVSLVTMWQAIKLLKETNQVYVRQGSRIHVGNKPGAEEAQLLKHASTTWESKRIRVEQDIFLGRFARQLPSMSELQAKYGAGYRTMRKVIASLVSEGILVSKQRKLFTPRAEARQLQNTICLIWETGKLEEVKVRPHRELQIIDHFERESVHAGVIHKYIPFNVDDPKQAEETQAALRKTESALGYIIHPISYAYDAKVMEMYVRLIHDLSRQEKPIIILDEIRLFTLPQPLASNRLIKIFRIGDALAGKSMARAMLSAGHTNIAFICRYQNEDWAIERFEAAKAEMARAGYTNAPSQFVIHSHFSITGLITDTTLHANELFSPAKLMEYDLSVDDEAAKRQTAELADYMRRHRTEIETIKNTACKVRGIPEENTSKKGLLSVKDSGNRWLMSEAERIMVGYLFEKASANPKTTAWICANDDIAVSALTYLSSRKVKVPESISVIGFDNNPHAFESGLSSYDFDIPNIIRQALAFVTYPNRTTRFARGPIVEMPGFVVHRRSTGRAKKS